MDSEVFHLVYISVASTHIDETVVRDIEKTSQRNNKNAGVTGILLFDDGRFMQFLEGSELEVRRIFSKITRDGRHEGIEVLRQQLIPQRQFSDWHMKYTRLDEVHSRQGPIYEKLFDLAASAKGALGRATESMYLLTAFKNSDLGSPLLH